MSSLGSNNYQAARYVISTTTGTINNLDNSGAGMIVMNNATLSTITGIVAKFAGQIVTVLAIGAGNVELAHQNAGSSAFNQLINIITASNTILTPGKAAIYQYDSATSRWRLIGITVIDASQITTGILPVANGGTGISSLTADQIPFGAGTSPFGSSANLKYASGSGLVLNNLFDISGAAGGQVKFPATQNASSNVNTLDDYEEGTWTPVIGGDGGTTGQTYTFNEGQYRKIGAVVIAPFVAVLSNKGTITGNVEIQGMPFTVLNVGNVRSVYSINWSNLATAIIIIQGAVLQGGTTSFIRVTTAAATSIATTLATADINNNTAFSGTLIYPTAS